MEFDKTLLAGSTGMLLLKLLEQEDMYGYQMIETLRSRSEHAFDLKAGTLYPLLHALEQKGYITARDEPSAAGRPRRYYHLTDAGRKRLQEPIHLRHPHGTGKRFLCPVRGQPAPVHDLPAGVRPSRQP